MQVHHVGHKIRGFYRVADYALRWGMIAKDAQRRLEILGFWRRHGVAATSLSGILCVRHTMSSERNMYAEASKEDAEGQRCCASGGVAQDSTGIA
jgi:hypothetical protein